jgi:hypothetical protein
MQVAKQGIDGPKSRYGCSECGKGFCINCFTAFHCTNALLRNKSILGELVAAVVHNNPFL